MNLTDAGDSLTCHRLSPTGQSYCWNWINPPLTDYLIHHLRVTVTPFLCRKLQKHPQSCTAKIANYSNLVTNSTDIVKPAFVTFCYVGIYVFKCHDSAPHMQKVKKSPLLFCRGAKILDRSGCERLSYPLKYLKATKCNFLGKDSWVLSLTTRSSNTDKLGWCLTQTANPKRPEMRLDRQLSSTGSYILKLFLDFIYFFSFIWESAT